MKIRRPSLLDPRGYVEVDEETRDLETLQRARLEAWKLFTEAVLKYLHPVVVKARKVERGYAKRAKTIQADAQHRYRLIREAFADRREQYPSEPLYTTRQRVASRFHVNEKTVRRALKEK